MNADGSGLLRRLSEIDVAAVVVEPKPWNITDDMSLDERALRSAFDPRRSTPDYEGPPVTPDLVRFLLKKYVEGLGEGSIPDDTLMGLANKVINPNVK
jgi:hypothetical protein